MIKDLIEEHFPALRLFIFPEAVVLETLRYLKFSEEMVTDGRFLWGFFWERGSSFNAFLISEKLCAENSGWNLVG